MSAKPADLQDVVRELAGNYAGLHRDVTALAETVRGQQAAISQITSSLSDIAATIRTTRTPELGKVITFALSVGALVSMLVAGITYIVAGSQLPHLDAIRSDVRLQGYRLDQLEKQKPADLRRAPIVRETPGS